LRYRCISANIVYPSKVTNEGHGASQFLTKSPNTYTALSHITTDSTTC